MGTWGAGIFSNDTACDVRERYRALLEAGVDDDAASRDTLDEHGTEDPVVWLALAAAQNRLGRLDESVRDRAIEIIDAGEDLAGWEDAEPTLVRARARALAKLRTTLTGPQPERRPVKARWVHHTNLQPGDVLRHEAGAAPSLWIVVEVERDPTGTHPLIQRLDGADVDAGFTSARAVWDLMVSGAVVPHPTWHEWWAVRPRRRDPDWADAGFSKLSSSAPVDVRPVQRASYVGLGWGELVQFLQRGINPFDGLYHLELGAAFTRELQRFAEHLSRPPAPSGDTTNSAADTAP